MTEIGQIGQEIYPEDKDDDIINKSVSEITKIYYKDVRQVAQRVVEELKQYIAENDTENDEDISEQSDSLIDQFSDENEWVFVNHLARITAVVSDNRDYVFDELDGIPRAALAEGTYDNVRAFWAFRQDVEEIVVSMWDEIKGIDPQAQHEQNSGIESIENDHGQ
jgi:hypothetical protein